MDEEVEAAPPNRPPRLGFCAVDVGVAKTAAGLALAPGTSGTSALGLTSGGVSGIIKASSERFNSSNTLK